MKRRMLFSLVFLTSFLVACSKEDPVVTEVFPPSLNFVEPSESPEEEFEELLEEEEPNKGQLIPEYATASSSLPDSPTESYHPDAAFDGSEFTVWVENGEGIGAWLCFHYPWLEKVQEIWIYNGHGEFSEKYALMTEISLTFSSGEEGTFPVTAGWNQIVFPEPILTSYVKMTALNLNKSQGQNVAVAEMKVFSSSNEAPTEQLGKETVLKNMGALGDCSNITAEQAQAFATELQFVMDWAEATSAERSVQGTEYGQYTGEALLFAGGDGVPVLYYDYDFLVVEDLFITETDLVVWDGQEAQGNFFEIAGNDTNINWILPGYVYENSGEYYFGLTEFDLYGSGSFGLIAIIGFEGGYPKDKASYLAFLSHQSRGAYTYEAELEDYLEMSYLSAFPTGQLATMVGDTGDGYFEFNGVNFYQKDLGTTSENYNSWVNGIRQARIDAGYTQVTAVQSGEVVLAGLLALASGQYDQEEVWDYSDEGAYYMD